MIEQLINNPITVAILSVLTFYIFILSFTDNKK